MTGTGTQADPYIVDTWADFVTAVGKSGVYVECAEGAVWDMNDIAPNGVGQVSVLAKSVNGNGTAIKSIFKNGGVVFAITSICTVSGFNITSFLVENGAALFRISCGSRVDCYLRNMRFSGMVTDSYFVISGGEYDNSYSRPIVYNSSFNIIFQGNSAFSRLKANSFPNAIDLYYCNVKFSGASTHTGATGTSIGYNAIAFHNCLVTGNNPFLNICIDGTPSSSYWWAWHSEYSVFNFVCESTQKINVLYSSRNQSSVCLINSDKLNGATVSAQNIKQVTEEQLGSASYLQSIGFPIGVE